MKDGSDEMTYDPPASVPRRPKYKNPKNSQPKKPQYIESISIDNLVPFSKHPFEPYDQQSFSDLVESVRTNGVMQPIIVRPLVQQEGKVEILSGHNRVTAAREAGLDSIHAVVYHGLSDNDALLIVTETILIQRSFESMSHSERAAALTIHYEALINSRGYRAGLVADVEKTMTNSPVANNSTKAALGSIHGLS